MTFLSFFDEKQMFFRINPYEMNQTEVSFMPLVADNGNIKLKKYFQCIDYCKSRGSRLPVYEEMHDVEQFKVQNQDMILNISASYGLYTDPKNEKITRDQCKSDGDSPKHIRFGEFLNRLSYFVWVRTDLSCFQTHILQNIVVRDCM